jgi:opacity protein-like surface antigen
MKVLLISVVVWVCAWPGATWLAAQGTKSQSDFARRARTVYVGVGYGPTTLTPSGDVREMNGIEYTFETKANDLGGMFYVGGWITEHIGLEVGTRNYGMIDAPFTFVNTHENTSGEGDSEVSMRGFNVSALFGIEPIDDIQLVARLGALTWKQSYESNFRTTGEPAKTVDMERRGTGPAAGLGLSYRFSRAWQMDLRYEYAMLDEDRVQLLTVGLAYDFIGLLPAGDNRSRSRDASVVRTKYPF